MSQTRTSKIAFVLISFALFGCTSKSQFSYQNSSPEVHYEPVNNQGVFTNHEVVEDPMRSQYEKGDWTASQESNVSTLGTDSSYKNRINIVFVGDGYTQAELPQYQQDVENNTELMKAQEPFKEYNSYFAFHRVDVVSKDSGVSQEVKGQSRNTALGMTYYCSGLQRLLCINANKAAKEAKNAPAVDSIFALANSDVYGGAGYRSPAISTLAARNPASVELALHEWGHSFALLGDEYEEAGSGQDCNSFPNVSSDSKDQMLSKQSKWYRWLDLPQVGAFAGACYSSSFFRPTLTSKMRELGQPFEVVNLEQFIISIYKKVHPVDSSTKQGTLKGNQVIELHTMKPTSHSLNIVWIVDSQIMTTAINSETLDTSTLGLSKGHSYKISARVWDPTTSVRDESARATYLTQTLNWKLKL